MLRLVVAALLVRLIQGEHSVAAGGFHSLFLRATKDGSELAVAGWNNQGQLCHPPSYGDQLLSPTISLEEMTRKINEGYQPRSVAAGEYHSVVLMQKAGSPGSQAFVFGLNDRGQLGRGDVTRDEFLVEALTTVAQNSSNPVLVKEVAAGVNHTLFLNMAGLVYGAGQNDMGQLCNNSLQDQHYPVPVFGAIRALAAGRQHSLFLSEREEVWACGSNEKGQLGTNDGNQPHLEPTKVLSDVRAIAAGYDHSLFLLNNGTVLAAGDNSQGQLGGLMESQVSRPTAVPGLLGVQLLGIAAGGHHSLFLGGMPGGVVWASGDNQFGQLGDDTTVGKLSIVEVKTLPSPVVDMSTGPHHSIFVGSDGTAYTTGLNNHGQLGIDSLNQQVRPTAAVQSIVMDMNPWRAHGSDAVLRGTTATSTSGLAATVATTTQEGDGGLAWWQWFLLTFCLLIPCCLVGIGFCCEAVVGLSKKLENDREEKAAANREWSRGLDEMDLTTEESRPLVSRNGYEEQLSNGNWSRKELG